MYLEPRFIIFHSHSTETPVLTKTRKRACLTLGGLAKSLHDKNLTKSDLIAEKIENWLDYHNECKKSGT